MDKMDKALDRVNKALDKTTDKTMDKVDKAMDKMNKALDKTTDKTMDKMDKALDKVNKVLDKTVLGEQDLFQRISQIQGCDKATVKLAEARQAMLAKPPGSLGALEQISVQLAGITGNLYNDVKKQCVAIFSSDNGVISEGVASAPNSVTMAQTINFTKRLTGVGALAKYFEVDLLVVDMGIAGNVPTEIYSKEISTEKIIDRKIAYGTKNLAVEPAMSREEGIHALCVGFEIVKYIKEAGYDVFGVGEMGIGNTTTSAAVLSALMELPATETVGKGGGILPESFRRKQEIVDDAVKRNGLTAKSDIIEVLSAVGGFDIAAMTGAFLGAAYHRLPVVIDGYISIVAALAAVRLAPAVRDYIFASHFSYEQGYSAAMEALDVRPMLSLNMRLGEGSGCPLAFKILEGACGVMNGMATFEEAAINDNYLAEIRKGDCF